MTLRISTSALLGALAALLVLAPCALAAPPATVTVRVEGETGTLVAPTTVTTTLEHVVKNGEPSDFCPGTSGLGALEIATGGNWSGTWFGGGLKGEKFVGLGYSIEAVDGESHTFGSGAFWDLWINHAESNEGACEAEPEAGSELLFFPCSETASECANPLGIEAPASADAGEPIAVLVKRYNRTGEGRPAAGVTVSGGSAPVITDAGGHATVVVASSGSVTLRASAPETVRAEATICIHNGADGTCGTTAPSRTSTVTAPKPEQTYTGPFAVVASVTGATEGGVYSPARAPRLLSGKVVAHTTISSVSLELRREYRGRCSAFDATTARFVRARCGTGTPFPVTSGSTFSYLLPSALKPGRYVLDVIATDAAGNHTALARGSSRIVFHVR